MIGRPGQDEAAPYYFTYIDQAPGDDPLALLEGQRGEAEAFFAGISEEKSRHRYADGKWSMRETLAHVNDTERVMAFRALWFARGFEEPLASFDQNVATGAAEADQTAWAEHAEEFRRVRAATIALFRHLPPPAWTRRGVASRNPFSVRALSYIIAGHWAHHLRILRERYV